MKKFSVALLCLFSLFIRAPAQDLSVGIDYLYWYVLQSNMTYGVVIEDAATFLNPRILNQKQDFGSGFRLNAAYACRPDFDVTFSWTRMHHSVSGSTSDPIILASLLLSPASPFFIGGTGVGGPASSKWDLHFDIFDLDFGVYPLCTRRYELRPYFGVKGGIINQEQFITYENFIQLGTTTILTATVDQRNNTWLLGPDIGFDSRYKIGCGFSLVADLSVAFLYGRHRTKVITEMTTGVPLENIYRNTKNRVRPVFQMLIGATWNTVLCNCVLLDIGIGYEVQYFFHTWRIVNSSIQDFFITNAGFGDLMMHGLTVGASITF